MNPTIILGTFFLFISLVLIYLPMRLFFFVHRIASEIPDDVLEEIVDVRKLIRRQSTKEIVERTSKKLHRLGLMILLAALSLYAVAIYNGSLPSEIFASYSFPAILFFTTYTLYLISTEKRADKNNIRYPRRDIFYVRPPDIDPTVVNLSDFLPSKKVLARNIKYGVKVFFAIIFVIILVYNIMRLCIYFFKMLESAIIDRIF